MTPNPKISVVMICYNHEKYIDEAIGSILSQTYHDFELIIVDDGSTDHTFEIIQGYQDPRISAVSQENSGPSIALNAGIDRCRGEFIAFMSGDDVSFPNRLAAQMEQIESQQADLLFCLPQIIGPDSEILNENICSWFFNKEFVDTSELYSRLFYFGNFLCAPSCFCRRTALEQVGQFKRGLIQLQDFDYWIRACKKRLTIKLIREPVIQYRFLWGANLSDYRNINRTNLENTAIYRSYFDEAPPDLLHEAFAEKITLDAIGDCTDIEIDKSFLFLEHSAPAIKAIGMERIISQFEDADVYEKLRTERKLDTASFFQLTQSNSPVAKPTILMFKRAMHRLRGLLIRYLGFIIMDAPKWTEAQVKQRVEYYLGRGEYKRAMMVVRGYRRFPPGPTIFATILRVLNKLGGRILRALNKLSGRIRGTLNKVIDTIRRVLFSPIMEGVFTLNYMYDYSKGTGCIVHEEPPERIYSKKPNVVGSFTGTFFEGETCPPRAYVSVIDHAIITGGSSLVITRAGDLLNDEMMDFPGEEFGIKSPYVKYRHKNAAILAYENKSNSHIKEGILLSCDHDNNYFHWLVECLPKLTFIDGFEQFKNLPIFVPQGLHINLIEALRMVNLKHRPVIQLEPGVAYQVDRLIFPSPLSRVVDRYQGIPSFDKDIILSHKWVAQTVGLLKNKSERKPWRKIYLTRNKGLRALGNREEIEEIMHKHDFELINLDGVSFKDQINIFSQAAVVVGPTGAAMTNMLLCQPGTKFIIFMSNHPVTNFYFWQNLGDIAGVDIKYIAGERLYNLTNYWSVHDDYSIDPRVLVEEIKQINLLPTPRKLMLVDQ